MYEEFEIWLLEKFDKISNIQLGLTYNCNLNCIFCFQNNNNNNNKSYLKLKDFKIILRKIKKFNTIKFIELTGGEPFLNPDILEIMELIGDDFQLEITSNGILINKQIIEKLKKVNLSNIKISVNAATPETYFKVNGKNYFERVLDNIRLLVKNHIPVTISYVVNKLNLHEIKKAENLFKELGVNIVFTPFLIENIYNKNLSNKSIRLSPQEILENYKTLKITKSLPSCSALRKNIFIDPMGDVYPCIVLPLKIGNLLNDNLEDILKSPYSTFLKRKIINSQKEVKDNVLFCPAINYSENRNFSKIPKYIEDVFNLLK